MNSIEYVQFRRDVMHMTDNNVSGEVMAELLMEHIQKFRDDISASKDITYMTALLSAERSFYNLLKDWIDDYSKQFKERWYHFHFFYKESNAAKLDALDNLAAYVRLHLTSLDLPAYVSGF